MVYHRILRTVPCANLLLSILNGIVCIYQLKLPVHPSPFPSPLGNHKSVLYQSVSVLQIGSFVPQFRFYI